MASPWDPLVRIEGLRDLDGPASISATLLDGVTATGNEGIWVPWWFAKQGSVEISGSFTTLSCQLYGTNILNPVNSYLITIGGTTFTAADTVTLNVTTPTGVLAALYTVAGGNTATSIAAGLVAVINASAVFAAYGFHASNTNAVLTLTWPSLTPNAGGGTFTTPSSPRVAPVVTVAGVIGGTGDETVAVATATTGSVIGSAVTATGLTQLAVSARWLKVRVTTLTGTGATVTAIAQGTA